MLATRALPTTHRQSRAGVTAFILKQVVLVVLKAYEQGKMPVVFVLYPFVLPATLSAQSPT